VIGGHLIVKGEVLFRDTVAINRGTEDAATCLHPSVAPFDANRRGR
jgi:hypothetical protein